MKKLLLLAIAFIAFQTSFAQTTFSKGDKLIEGSVSYTKTKDVDASYTFSPTVGYFLNDKTAVGVSVETGKASTGSHTCLGVFARHYFLNVGQNFKVYSQLGVNNNNDDADTKAYISADLGLGLNYFVTKNLALTTSLTSLASYNDQTSTFTVGFGDVKNPFTTATPKFGLLYRF